jgi:hypothetical protein
MSLVALDRPRAMSAFRSLLGGKRMQTHALPKVAPTSEFDLDHDICTLIWRLKKFAP